MGRQSPKKAFAQFSEPSATLQETTKMVPTDTTKKPLRHPDTASRTFESEVVIVAPGRNMVRMLNPVGSRIWELADGQHTMEEITATLLQEYDVSPQVALNSTQQFMGELTNKGLLTWM